LVLERQRARASAIEKATGKRVEWVFWPDGTRIEHFRRSWLSACERAGLVAKMSGGRRCGTLLASASIARRQMEMVGHKTESIYRRYAIVAEADLADGVKKLAALMLADSPASGRIVALFRREGAQSRVLAL
jgi:hypothetical protein